MSVQQESVYMGAYFLNGRRKNNPSSNAYQEWTPIDGYPLSFDIWSVSYKAVREYISTPLTTALMGYERGNTSGIRLRASISLRNTNSAQSEALRQLIGLMSSQYDRTIVQAQITNIVSSNATQSLFDTNLTATYPNTISNAYQGAFVQDNNGSFLCTRYSQNATIKQFTVNGNVVDAGWTTGTNINVYLPPSVPTVIGLSTDETESNMHFYNPVGSTFGIERELTIGNQIISFDLKSVDRFQYAPTNLKL